MDFGSIVGFLAILFISSLFNKNNKVTKPPSQPSRSVPAERSTKRAPNASKSKRTTFTGGLEDLFNELRGEVNRTFGETEKKQFYSQQDDVNIDNVAVKDNVQKSSYPSSKNHSQLDKDSVYAREIGNEEIPIEFNRKSIVQGIIMSEVLQKPKSLRR